MNFELEHESLAVERENVYLADMLFIPYYRRFFFSDLATKKNPSAKQTFCCLQHCSESASCNSIRTLKGSHLKRSKNKNKKWINRTHIIPLLKAA